MIYDQKTKVTALKLKNISQSSAKQRAGRAGRTN
jgi:HrpA-like RNA helicase